MSTQYIWLSHVLSSETPVYGGGKEGFKCMPDKQMCDGDSCNTVTLEFSNHLGSHVDAPQHFIPSGITVDDFSPADWIFNKPLLIEIDTLDSELITEEHFQLTMFEDIKDADLVLIKTGFEKYRYEERYWKSAPGFSENVYNLLADRFASFNAIGMDTISMSSLSHRATGRKAHRTFLGAGIRIFEDLMLSNLSYKSDLNKVYAFPLRYKNADGAPTTMVGEIGG